MLVAPTIHSLRSIEHCVVQSIFSRFSAVSVSRSVAETWTLDRRSKVIIEDEVAQKVELVR